MREVSSLDLPDREGIEQRIRDVVSRLVPEVRVDELELSHLADVVTNHTLLLNDLYSARRLDQIMGQDSISVLHSIPELTRHEEEISSDAIRKIRSIPDDIRVVGDKCLYDVGLFGRQDYRGLDLRQLGVRCYHLASELLEHLADDRRLRDYFRQNRLAPMPIEEEVVFLRQCATRFTIYTSLLRSLHIFDPVPAMDTTGNVGAPDVTRASPPAPATAPPAARPEEVGADLDEIDPSGSETPRGGRREMREALPFEAAPLASMVPGADKLPRRDLLSLYERLVLFSNLDVPGLRGELNRVVVDQPEAVDSLCDELSLYATGTQSLSRPASFFFVGPTGVGKNHLAECLIRALESVWGIQIPFLLLEGPQYTYPSDINELKGAARGFIRSDEEGILTEFYERASSAPLSVILIDEVEKSHPQFRKFFLGLMDRGTTMDNHGDTLHFVNTLFVYTSNVGYSRLQTSTQPIGFGDIAAHDEFKHREVVQDLKKILTPEFVNRVSVIRFRPLTRSSVERIFDLEFEKVATRYREMQGISLILTREAREEMILQGYNPEYGARPLARLINTIANVEVSKRLKKDEMRGSREMAELLAFIREAREGQRAIDPAALSRVLEHTRVQVGYVALEIGWDGQAYTYKPVRVPH